jgi:hypothetical protein
MRNLYKLLVITALAAVIAFSFAACGDDGGGPAAAPQSVTYISKDDVGNRYTLVITENTKRSARYAANEGDDFKFTVELFQDGTYTVALTYSGKVESAGGGGANISITVNDKKIDITVSGTDMKEIKGTIVLDNKEEITLDKPLTALENKPENWPEANRWWKWVDSTSTATLDYSVDGNGVCTVNVGGKAEPNNETGIWKAQAGYSYTGKAGKSYDYTFEAWTQSGTRDLLVPYYDDNDGAVLWFKKVPITTTKKTYTVKGRSLPKGGDSLKFFCAEQLGTYYVKVISITEVNGRVDKTITITGITGKTGNDTQLWIHDDYNVVEDHNVVVAGGWGGKISGNSASVSFNLEEADGGYHQTGDPWFGSGSYYLMLCFDNNGKWDTNYYYMNGQQWAGWGNLQKYNITSATSTINFDKFALSE